MKRKIDVRELMMSLEVDPVFGCMHLPGKKGKWLKETCDRIWVFFNGPRPLGRTNHLRHLCNRGHMGCCNIAHLKMGTAKENTRDSILAGTHCFGKIILSGENHPSSKLDINQCREIKIMLSHGNYHRDIARKFNVSRASIKKISQGLHWSQKV